MESFLSFNLIKKLVEHKVMTKIPLFMVTPLLCSLPHTIMVNGGLAIKFSVRRLVIRNYH